jgi:hypothetical protein
MADASSADEQPALPVRVARTVTPPYRGRPDEEMNVIGYLLFAGLVMILIPLAPLLLLLWLLSELRDSLRQGRIMD